MTIIRQDRHNRLTISSAIGISAASITSTSTGPACGLELQPQLFLHGREYGRRSRVWSVGSGAQERVNKIEPFNQAGSIDDRSATQADIE